MEASQRWGLAAVLALAIGAIAFVAVQYDRFVGISGIPLVVALTVVFVKPVLAPRVTILAGLVGIVVAVGYMVWAGMHGDEIADPHAATRSVQMTLAVCGLALLTGRAAAMKAPAISPKALSEAEVAHRTTDAMRPHRSTDAIRSRSSTDPIPRPKVS
jgi:hypothetical protein